MQQEELVASSIIYGEEEYSLNLLSPWKKLTVMNYVSVFNPREVSRCMSITQSLLPFVSHSSQESIGDLGKRDSMPHCRLGEEETSATVCWVSAEFVWPHLWVLVIRPSNPHREEFKL